MKKICTWIFFTLALLLSSPNTQAYSRRFMPLNVAVAQADAIVHARTTRAPQRHSRASSASIKVQIKHVFKGSLPPGPVTVELPPHYILAIGRLESGKDYIFFLRTTGAELPKLEVLLDGNRPYTDDYAGLVASAIKLTPAWSKSHNGLSTMLTTDKFLIKADEDLNLWVGCRNTSQQPITLQRRDWPLDTHTYWTLDVESETAGVVLATPHPTLTIREISGYFSRFPNLYDIVLQPGQEHFFPLLKINSAKPGWGHKQELDFNYYPMPRPGQYTITATGHHFLKTPLPPTTALTVWVE